MSEKSYSQVHKKKNFRKENRELVLNISMFLLTNEKMKNLFWNVKTVTYSRSEDSIKIGINTTKKLGTTLEKLRSVSKDLSNYLFDQGLTIRRQTKVSFFVDKEDEIVARIYNLIEKTAVEPEVELETENALDQAI
jgi:hypothetical protein